MDIKKVLESVLTVGLPIAVKYVDKVLGNGTGPLKKDLVVSAITGILAVLQKTAGSSVGLPGPAEVPNIVQAVVDMLNRAGELKGIETELGAAPITTWPGAMEGVSKMLEGALLVIRSAKAGS